MKKILIVLMSMAVALVLFTSCETTTIRQSTRLPYAASVSFPAAGTYRVLGRVDYRSTIGDSGYLSFLEHAKTIYPETDDVVNILVDSERIVERTIPGALSFAPVTESSSATYTMTGIAIEYIE